MKLIIFDFDGTLGDTRANIVLTMQRTLRQMGYPVASEEAIAATIGLPLETGFEVLIPGISTEDTLRCAATYREIFEVYREQLKPQPFPHVKETLALLKQQGYTMTVASSRMSVSLNAFIRDMGLADCISYVLGADNVAKAKPDPEPVLQTLRDLNTAAAETMVVGDMPVDILMGRNAGCATCGVTWGNSDREALRAAGADFIIDDFADFPACLE
ncbi:MAG: HAD family hydrolase [Bacteroidales bacterium]|nr:HAD family hydrolase [Bacteroidales bacterium]